MENVYPQFYEFFDSVPIPDSLKDKIIDENGRSITSIKGTKKINIIVGENDSGKSYLMRELFKNPQEPNYESERLHSKIKTAIEQSLSELIEILQESGEVIGEQDWSVLSNPFDENDLDGWIVVTNKLFPILTKDHKGRDFQAGLLFLYRALSSNKDLIQNINNIICRLKPKSVSEPNNSDVEKLDHKFDIDRQKLIAWMGKTIDCITPFIFNNLLNSSDIHIDKKFLSKIQNTFNYHFIHHLRTLRKEQLKDLNSIVGEIAFGELSFWKEHNVSSKSVSLKDNNSINSFVKNGYVETGITLHKDFEDRYFTVRGRKVLSKYERLLSELVFDGEEVAIVPARSVQNESGKSLSEFQIQIGDQKPRPINELGTGIQMIILLTWFMFESDYGVVFIEEPELFIHPGLQRQLMNIYARYPKSHNFKFFIATHSNHITDFIQYEPELCSMYMIKKVLGDNPEDPKFILKHYSEDEVLQTLGVTQSSLFLANCTIWVEGNTDWKYIRTWFEIYLKTKEPKEHFKEGLHYTFVEYGGSLLAHWFFSENNPNENYAETISVPKVSRNAFVIGDGGADPSSTLKEKKLKINDANLFVTKNYEIENLLKPEILIEILTVLHQTKTKNVQGPQNQQDFIADFKNTQVPSLIHTYFQHDNGEKLRESDKWDNYYKQKLCRASCEIVKEKIKESEAKQKILTEADLESVLSKEAVELCRRMFEFIKVHNSK